MELPEEQALRRKPSQKKPPKKARHKHNYKPCIYHIVVKHGHLDLERGFVPEIRTVPGDYCITCGKVGDVHYFWGLVSPRVPAELPTDVPEFDLVDNVWQKYVNLEEATHE